MAEKNETAARLHCGLGEGFQPLFVATIKPNKQISQGLFNQVVSLQDSG
jgi:hypothetical protein